LDYVYGTVFVGSTISRVGAPVVIEPGTAIAVNEPTAEWGATYGFILFPGSTLVAHGTPNNPTIITTTDSVQEGQAGNGHTSFNFVPSWWYEDSYDDYFTLPTPSLSFRFCNFFLPETSWMLGAG